MNIFKLAKSKINYFYTNFVKLKNTDIFLVGYPRSGSTWVRYILAYIYNSGYEVSKEEMNKIMPEIYGGLSLFDNLNPRIIKSHEPYTSRYKKVLYLLRDGRDVAASYYDYYRRNKNYDNSFSQFLNDFLQPSFDFNSWPLHVNGWLNNKFMNILVVRYEDLLSDYYLHFRRICEFIGLHHNYNLIHNAIMSSTRDKISQKVGKRRVGIGKGTCIWKEFFNEENLKLFNEKAGKVLLQFGYPIIKSLEDSIHYPKDLEKIEF